MTSIAFCGAGSDGTGQAGVVAELADTVESEVRDGTGETVGVAVREGQIAQPRSVLNVGIGARYDEC